MSHRDWLETDAARARIQQQWSLFFREFDVVLYPSARYRPFRRIIRCRLSSGT